MPCGEDILDKHGCTLYVAFNVNCPRHFLHPSSLQDFLAQDPVPSLRLAAVFAGTPTGLVSLRTERLAVRRMRVHMACTYARRRPSALPPAVPAVVLDVVDGDASLAY